MTKIAVYNWQFREKAAGESLCVGKQSAASEHLCESTGVCLR
ncbi:hypothetical protein [Ruminococcus sp. NK3A76]|nr:hypothetical protein [Ruminococcus sp. NK3A76]